MDRKTETRILCPYCNQPARLTTGKTIHPLRPDLAAKRFWNCKTCHAYVGCHDGTNRPLGSLANSQLRADRQKAHNAFDKIWRKGLARRAQAYFWLAHQLRIPINQCHIGMFDSELCERVVQLSTEFKPKR